MSTLKFYINDLEIGSHHLLEEEWERVSLVIFNFYLKGVFEWLYSLEKKVSVSDIQSYLITVKSFDVKYGIGDKGFFFNWKTSFLSTPTLFKLTVPFNYDLFSAIEEWNKILQLNKKMPKYHEEDAMILSEGTAFGTLSR